MRCREAREILNAVMDGEESTRAALATAHVESCADCREWHEAMLSALALLAAAKAATPSPDLSGRIMSGLPARHPASWRPAPAFDTRKLIYVMAACWLLGAVMMAAGTGIWAYYFGGSPHEVAVSAKASAGAAGSVAKAGWTTTGALLSPAVKRVLEALSTGASGFVTFLIVDTLVLLTAALLWLKRRTLAGPFSIMP